MSNEITVKMIITENINKELLMSIINGLNDNFLPVNEISVNGKLVFDNTQGFIKED